MRVISGKARGTILKTPTGMATRPTADRVKEAMFSIIQFDVPAASVLDLFAGTGQLGIEALSRGAKHAVFVDQRKDSVCLVKENLKRSHMEEIGQVFQTNYESYLSSCNAKFDIIFLDPPYAEVFLENSLKMITEIDILQSNGIIVTERPVDKELLFEKSGWIRSKDYKYGNTILTMFRKEC
jgi:16S rRNA (guanine(966)-N(2))-methyltransferase RsmD